MSTNACYKRHDQIMDTIDSIGCQILHLKGLLEEEYQYVAPDTNTGNKDRKRIMGTFAALQSQISHLVRALDTSLQVRDNDESDISDDKPKKHTYLKKLRTEHCIPKTISIINPMNGVTKYTNLGDVEKSVVDYIFDDSMPMTEVLVDNDSTQCDRKRLLSLKPKTWVEDDVISTVAYHQTLVNKTKELGREGDLVCFLPATLATYAASGVQTPEQAYENYWLSFLHNAEQCKKVFVPMNDNRTHWYLAVIIFIEKKVHMVDSDPNPITHENRVCAIKTMMDFMSELFHIIYAKASQQEAPKISEFDIIVPHGIARQPNGYDCGLWVCLWIINANTTNKYNIDVGDSTRMHLALNLVMSFKNYIRETITRRSKND